MAELNTSNAKLVPSRCISIQQPLELTTLNILPTQGTRQGPLEIVFLLCTMGENMPCWEYIFLFFIVNTVAPPKILSERNSQAGGDILGFSFDLTPTVAQQASICSCLQ